MHYNIDHGINISLDPRFLCREPGAHGLLVHSSKSTAALNPARQNPVQKDWVIATNYRIAGYFLGWKFS